MSSFDITLFPFILEAGNEHYDLPGLMAVPAPKRATRLRAQDSLILFVRLLPATGQAPDLTTAQLKEILSRLAETYFKSSGSVTAGLRITSARLNEFLFNRNVKAANQGQMSGSLTLAVVHAGTIFVAHTGPTHTFLINKSQSQHFDDGMGMRGLGISRLPVTRFYQSAVEAGDMLVFCPTPPPGWEKSLNGLAQLNFDHIRRRFVADAGEELQVAAIRFTAGKGQVQFWRPSDRQAGSASQAAGRLPLGRAARQAGNTQVGAAPQAQAAASFPAEGAPAVEISQPSAPDFDSQFAGSLPVPANEGQAPGPAVSQDIPDQEPTAGAIINQAGEPGRQAELHANADVSLSTPYEEQGLPGEALHSPPSEQTIFLGGIVPPGSDSALPPRPQADPQKPGQGISRESSRSPARLHPDAAGQAGSNGQTRHIPAKPAGRRPAITKPAGPPVSERLRLRLAPAWNQARGHFGRLNAGLAALVTKALPKSKSSDKHPSEPWINLSPAKMLMIAIIIPALVVAAATTVYFRSGRSEQYTALFNQAQQYAAQAYEQGDPELQKQAWTTTYNLVLEAQKYDRTDESDALRRQALKALDDLQGISRLDFQLATSSAYPDHVSITRMVATLNQVFMLDSSDGSIKSMTRITTGGYEPNFSFVCEPTRAGSRIIGPMIDLAEIPINNEMNADIMGIDAGGNLVYCSATKSTIDSLPLELPDAGWGKITAITTYGDTLYILDPVGNAVYRYDGIKGMFQNKPHLYFDQEIPNLSDVIDMAIDQEFLYLLHANGQMTVCTSGGVAYGTTRCIEPSPYGDPRSGRDPEPLSFPDANFIQLQTTQPPDPSLFTLDAKNKAVYHLSQRRLNLQHEYRGMLEGENIFPNQPPTAFAVTPNRRALIAFGNEVFVAPLP